MNPTVKSSLIRLGKAVGTMVICVTQVLFFFQVMPYGGLYIGLLSLVLDLAMYCWIVSGAYKALSAPPRRKKISRPQIGPSRQLLVDQQL